MTIPIYWWFPNDNNNNNPQLLVIRQHEAIAAANVPSVFETLPGWDQHQVRKENCTKWGQKWQVLLSPLLWLLLTDVSSSVFSGWPERRAGSAGNLSRTERSRRRHRQVRYRFWCKSFAYYQPNIFKQIELNQLFLQGSLPGERAGWCCSWQEVDQDHHWWRVDQNSFRNIFFIC